MEYGEAIAFIREADAMGCTPGLSRVTELLARLGNPQNKIPCIHIAGTNGKGSAASMLASILQAAGLRTGLFTTPHLDRYNERIRVNGEDIPDAGFAEMACRVREAVREMRETPSEFERFVPLAFLWFLEQKCDIAVIETGMGGRLDATNVIAAPELEIITQIAMDHTEYLGNTIEAIAYEKAGIIRPDSDVIMMCQKRGAPDDSEKSASKSCDDEYDAAGTVIRKKCQELHARLHVTDPYAFQLHDSGIDRQVFSYRGRDKITLNLAGSFQKSNVMTVLDAVDVLKEKRWRITEEAIRRGLAQVRWPGRFELVHRAPDVILDGAHNVDGVRKLAGSLRELLPGRKILFVMGVLADKEYMHMIQIIAPLASGFITTEPDNARALPAEELCRVISRETGVPAVCGGGIRASLGMALEQCPAEGVICVFGSLYQAGEVRAFFDNRAEG